MSGRVVWYRNGERTTGFRKTDRRQSKPKPRSWSPCPEYRISFFLPRGLSLPPGPISGVSCATSHPLGRIEISAGARDWAISKVVVLMHEKAPRWRGVILARLSRSTEPGPTLSGPLRRGETGVIEIRITADQPMITDGQGMRQLPLWG